MAELVEVTHQMLAAIPQCFIYHIITSLETHGSQAFLVRDVETDVLGPRRSARDGEAAAFPDDIHSGR